MKRIAYSLFTAFLAIGAVAAIPDTAEGWYTPDEFTATESKGTLSYRDEKGVLKDVDVNVDEKGGVINLEDSDERLGVAYPAYLAMVEALKAETIAKQNTERIQTIGKHLDSLFRVDGIPMEMTKQGPGNSGSTVTYTLKIKPGGGGDGVTIEATDPIPYGDVVDGKAIGWTQYNADGQLTLIGWRGGKENECNTDMNTIMTEQRDDNRRNHYVLTRLGTGSDAIFHYVPFGGRLEVGDGAPPDEMSITTNAAGHKGELRLKNMDDDEDYYLPYNYAGSLLWGAPTMWDGDTVQWTKKSGGDGYVAELAGFTTGGAIGAGHYYGMAVGGNSLGFHELPNVTTNTVVADEYHLTTDIVNNGETKVFRFKLPSDEGPYAVTSDGYVPIANVITNSLDTNRWEALLGWIEDGTLGGESGITFSDSNLDQYLRGTLGYIYSTTADDLYFDNDGDGVEASFAAPSNWADGASVEVTGDGAYQIKGFADASACAASVSAMLSEPTGSDATTHLFLAKKTNTGELHYVPIGGGVSGGAPVDGVTITTNTAEGAATQGLMSLYGWSGAGNDTYLSKNGSGSLEWRRVNPMPGVDDTTIATNTSNQLVIKGFDTAQNKSILWKDEEGNFAWGGFSSATNVILAGAGINITDNGGGAITISTLDSAIDSTYGTHTITVVTAVQYDETSHKFQKKTRTLTFKGVVGSESDWTDVFETVSHKSEHTQGESSP